MIIACPACATRYVVPDSAIGAEGRTVRCAKCKHSWFQDGPDIAVPDGGTEDRTRTDQPAPSQPREDARPYIGAAPPASTASRNGAAPPEASQPPVPKAPAARYDDNEPDFSPGSNPQDDDSTPSGAVPPDKSFGPSFDEGDDPPYGELPDARPRPTVYDDTVSQFDYSPPFRSRRNYVRLWTWAAGIFAVLALGTVVAVNTSGLPSWMPVDRPLFAVAEPDLELEFPVEEQERRTLPNGTEYFGARIIVTNTARETRAVPPILIVLRDGRERIVFSWEVTPPQTSLAPGESITINEAMTDVPRSAVFADIGWAPR